MRVENVEILLKIIHNCVVWYETNSPYNFNCLYSLFMTTLYIATYNYNFGKL